MWIGIFPECISVHMCVVLKEARRGRSVPLEPGLKMAVIHYVDAWN